jgi:hypothetical protein
MDIVYPFLCYVMFSYNTYYTLKTDISKINNSNIRYKGDLYVREIRFVSNF